MTMETFGFICLGAISIIFQNLYCNFWVFLTSCCVSLKGVETFATVTATITIKFSE